MVYYDIASVVYVSGNLIQHHVMSKDKKTNKPCDYDKGMGQVANDPQYLEPRRGIRMRAPNRKYTTDLV